MSDCEYVFLDESGNLDFSASGTRYFVLTSVSTRRPFTWRKSLDDLKYDCLEYGLENEYFHCADDNKHVRNKVFNIIGEHLSDMRIDSLIVEKSKTAPALAADSRFYPEMLGHLLKNVLRERMGVESEEFIVITDAVPLKKKRKMVQKAVKIALANVLPRGKKHRILHHDSRSHYGLQLADYSCWSVFRKHERGETAYFQRISSAVRSEFDIFARGATHYY